MQSELHYRTRFGQLISAKWNSVVQWCETNIAPEENSKGALYVIISLAVCYFLFMVITICLLIRHVLFASKSATTTPLSRRNSRSVINSAKSPTTPSSSSRLTIATTSSTTHNATGVATDAHRSNHAFTSRKSFLALIALSTGVRVIQFVLQIAAEKELFWQLTDSTILTSFGASVFVSLQILLIFFWVEMYYRLKYPMSSISPAWIWKAFASVNVCMYSVWAIMCITTMVLVGQRQQTEETVLEYIIISYTSALFLLCGLAFLGFGTTIVILIQKLPSYGSTRKSMAIRKVASVSAISTVCFLLRPCLVLSQLVCRALTGDWHITLIYYSLFELVPTCLVLFIIYTTEQHPHHHVAHSASATGGGGIYAPVTPTFSNNNDNKNKNSSHRRNFRSAPNYRRVSSTWLDPHQRQQQQQQPAVYNSYSSVEDGNYLSDNNYFGDDDWDDEDELDNNNNSSSSNSGKGNTRSKNGNNSSSGGGSGRQPAAYYYQYGASK